MQNEYIKAYTLSVIGGFIVSGILITFVIGVIKWTDHRDAQLMEWAEKYEQCVAQEYHTTPSEYYQKWGQYPECDVTKK